MRLSRRIRAARQAAGLSQEILAAKIGVTRGAVSNWERADGSVPARDRLEKIATISDVSYEWLATGRGRMSLGHSPEDIPAIDADWVEEPDERRLLEGYRAAPERVRQQMLGMVLAWMTN